MAGYADIAEDFKARKPAFMIPTVNGRLADAQSEGRHGRPNERCTHA